MTWANFPDAVGAPGHPNEPTGMTPVVVGGVKYNMAEGEYFDRLEKPFTTCGPRPRVVDDLSSPVRSTHVLEQWWKADDRSGQSNGNHLIAEGFISRIDPGATPQEIYIHEFVKWSRNWVNHPIGFSRFLYVALDGEINMPFSLALVDTALGLQVQVRFQSQLNTAHDLNLFPNVANGLITRGAWHQIELHAVLNSHHATVEQNDGTLDIWIDGVQTHDYTGLHMVDSTGTKARTLGEWYWGTLGKVPRWGGDGSVLHENAKNFRTTYTYVSYK